MRTRPPSHSRSRPFRVNVVTDDGLVLERVRLLQARTSLRITLTRQPLSPQETDVYVLGVGDLERLAAFLGPSESSPVLPPVLAFGPAAHLRAAFVAGCADYLREPWDPAEMEIRVVRAADLRHGAPPGGWGVVVEGRSLRLPDGTAVRLSAHEAVVADLLFANQGVVVSRRALSYALWGRIPSQSSRAVDMHVSAIRRKLGRDLISCVRGQGYVVSAVSEDVTDR